MIDHSTPTPWARLRHSAKHDGPIPYTHHQNTDAAALAVLWWFLLCAAFVTVAIVAIEVAASW